MTKTTLDIVTAAARRIGVAAVDVPLDAAIYEIGADRLTDIYAEIPDHGITTLTDANAVPDKASEALIRLVATRMSSEGLGNPYPGEVAGWRLLRQHYLPDDRDDPRDTDDDGTVTDAENEAFDRSAFY